MLVSDGISAATSRERREASAPASALGTNPVTSMASRIRRRVSGETLEGSLSARETVTCETPASRPMVDMVTRLPPWAVSPCPFVSRFGSIGLSGPPARGVRRLFRLLPSGAQAGSTR